ncbi:MAG: Spy/CpxP family protein refolding chaperone [Thermoguttaceae bacterium]
MSRLTTSILLLILIATGCNKGSAAAPKVADGAETKYLLFQVWPRMPGYPGIPPLPGHLALSKAQMADFAGDVVKAIGTTGDARHKLGFAVGPLCFDMPDEETRQFIRDAFTAARENDVAVGFHIDDSMSWGQRKDLLSNPDNIETADWKQIPNTARRLDWGVNPTKFPPQMCYNSPAIVAAVKDRAGLIGAEIKRELAVLKSEGKQHLFAGVIAGSETMMGEEFGTGRRLGFRALSHRGFSESNPPKDINLERASIVKEFMELWANSLHAAGVPRERIFCHIAFTSQGLRPQDAKDSYMNRVHFAPPEVAFSSAYRPGFSTYPEGRTFTEIHAALAKHDSPGWISAEGTNVSPTSMPGEPTMETYLGRIFNHGGVMVNVFSWGIGGEAQRNNFFRRATENPEALGAYAKFLRGEPLVESAAQGFSGPGFQAKMHRIQTELLGWIHKSGQQAQAMPLIKNIQALIKGRKWQEADKVADELLALMNGDSPAKAKTEALPLMERLPPKIHRIQKELPAWIEKADADKKKKAAALMHKLDEHLKAKNFEEAEKNADSILKMMGVSAGAAAPDTPVAAKTDSAEAVRKRLTEKVDRVKQGVQKWADSGHDPSAIFKTMTEKFKPLMDAGKVVEAEAELDRVLEQFKPDTKSTKSPTAPVHGAQDITEALCSKLTHNIGSSFLVFRRRVQEELKATKGQRDKLDQFLGKLLPDAMQALRKSNGERQKYNQKTHEQMAAALNETLNEGQRTRLRQLERQRDGLFSEDWTLKELQVTDEQRKQFMALIQQTREKTKTLMDEIRKGANPDEIRPKVLKLRLDLEGQLEALLTDAQKEQWKEMLGKPVDLGVLFDDVSSR